MKTKNVSMLSRLSLCSGVLLLLVTACQSTIRTDDPAGVTLAQKSGSQLWAENCRRCHNFRTPTEFSDSEWNAIAFHMRVRGNLTGHEYREILKFLKSSN